MPDFVTLAEAVAIHDDQIASYGGSSGIRDEGLLESALAQPQASFSGKLLHPTIHEQAAAYLYHLAQNHPFVDGNKRTATDVMLTFLRVNSYRLTLSDKEIFEIVLQIATGQLSKTELTTLIEQHLAQI